MAADPIAERKAQTRAVFDQIVPDYDAGGPGCFATFGRRLVAEVGIAPGQRVLDVATGRGAALFPAAEAVGPTGAVTGIDLSEGMVRATREEAARRGVTAEVVVGDAEALDFPDATFDRVLCGFGLMFLPQVALALAEFRRVLRPGGRLGVSTWQVTQADDLGAVLAAQGLLDVNQEVLRFSVAEELQRALEEAEFTAVRVRPDTVTFRYDDLAAYWQNARGTGIRRWLDRLDEAQRAQVRAALAQRVQARQRADGLHLPATALLAVAAR